MRREERKRERVVLDAGRAIAAANSSRWFRFPEAGEDTEILGEIEEGEDLVKSVASCAF
jgi:hypothetical protein